MPDNLARKLESEEEGPNLGVIDGGKTAGALASAEKGEGEAGKQANPHDIAKQEHEPRWMTSTMARLEQLEAKRQNAIAASQNKENSFFARHKKGVVGGLIGLVMGGGMFIFAGLLTGPMQLVHIYHLFDDTYNAVHLLATAYREGRVASSLAKGLGQANEERLANTRIGAAGRKIASGYEAKMAQKGVYLGLDSAGRPTMSIDSELLIGSSHNLKNPNEEHISTQEQHRRNQAIEHANAELARVASEQGLSVKPITAESFRNNSHAVVDIYAPPQIGTTGKWDAHKFLRKLNEIVGMGKVSGEIGMRAYATKSGFVNALFHPVQAASTKFNNFVHDRVTSLFSRMQSTPEQARVDALARTNQDLERAKETTTEKSARAEIEEHLRSNHAEIESLERTHNVKPRPSTGRPGYVDQIFGAHAAKATAIAEKVNRYTGIIALVISIVCLLHDLAESGAIDAFAHTVIPAIKLGSLMTNFGPQMMAGDLSLDDIGAITKAFIYDDKYPVVVSGATSDEKKYTEKGLPDEQGNEKRYTWTDYLVESGTGEISETVTSSFWDACTVRSELDPSYECSDKQKLAVNSQLTDVAKGTIATTIQDNIKSSMNAAIPGSGIGTMIIDGVLGGVCSEVGILIVTVASVTISGIVAWFTGDWAGFGMALAGAMINYAPGLDEAAKRGANAALDLAGLAMAPSLQGGIMFAIQNGLGPAMDIVGANIWSEDIDWITSSPEEKGNIAAYGASYNAQMIGISDGGVALSPQQARAWKTETNIYLAEEFAEKPLLAKLFDVSDYRSMIAVLGRNANINPNSGVGTQLANTAKMLGVLPTLAFSTFFNGRANAVMAASGAPNYDYNVPTVTIPLDVLGEMNNRNDATRDIYTNAEKVAEILRGNRGAEYDEKVKICLGKAINHADLSVSYVDPTDQGYGITFYYMEKGAYHDSNCSGLMDKDSGDYDPDFVRLAVYSGLDWGIINSQACYFGDEDACRIVGVVSSSGGRGGSSGSSQATAGGLNLSQAEALLEYYRNMPDSEGYAAGMVLQTACYGLKYNCVAFSRWFTNTFVTTSKWGDGGHGNGVDIASNLGAAQGWVVDNIPGAFSIFSAPGPTPEGHTGVVLGVIDQDTLIIGQASCYIGPGDTWAKERKISEFEAIYGKLTFAHIPENEIDLATLNRIIGGT